MRYRLLGRTGLRVSELFLGAMTFGEGGGVGVPREEAARILDTYAEAGGNVVDTAVNYGDGQSESIVGELLKGRRDRFVLSTKYTCTRDGEDPNAAGNHRKNLTRSLETSLRRLGTDYIDLYWVHIWDPNTPVEETMRALDDAVRSGKVLYIGVSDAPAWLVSRANTLAELRGWTEFAGLQVPYSLLNRDVERELLPMAEALGLSVAAWSPLQGGILSGKYTRPGGVGGGEPARLDAGAVGEREHAVARAVGSVADELGVSPAQVALAWTMTRSAAVHPIVGARRAGQLADNLGAAGLTLPAELMTRLEEPTGFRLGFPAEFIDATSKWVYGAAGQRVVPRRLP
ncbi:aldo/keto reductase [Streptomyces cinnabarinus]|uniref:Aldo/keto reductase n=1 Tax=Streptomyces cinnabarinus TaxID=67287 RepID=A0ABY7KKI9_9ACTN|nr:aldo/keto reductase [Streptomyces cinnabarinus]WAZ25050.1 aldo/keto reductase [Streptomyces cinnabarinus]